VGPRFEKASFLSSTSLEVNGRFETHAEVIDDVIIRIVVIPEGHIAALTSPMVGEAKVAASALTTINVPTTGRPDDKLTYGSFAGTVTVPPGGTYAVAVGDTVRLIGLSVAVKAPDDPVAPNSQDPPGFETFTWCVSREVVP
jgi:hypothetical protein